MKKKFYLEKEALLASGIKKENELVIYQSKLDILLRRFLSKCFLPYSPLSKAKAIFSWLWEEKPTRYVAHSHFRLSEVIDAQLSKENRVVGNCLGLTLLYNCLVRKMGIYTEALYLEDAFGVRPHVLTLLQTEDSLIDIENILPDGFDYKGHLDNPSRKRWGDKELVADIYHSIANDYFERGEFADALKSYDMAIQLNPSYEKVHLNKAILIDKIGWEKIS